MYVFYKRFQTHFIKIYIFLYNPQEKNDIVIHSITLWRAEIEQGFAQPPKRDFLKKSSSFMILQLPKPCQAGSSHKILNNCRPEGYVNSEQIQEMHFE